MRVIGFNLNKVHAEKGKEFSPGDLNININIEFTKVEKETLEFLKEKDALKIAFKSALDYTQKDSEDKQAEIIFEGLIVLAAEEKESKDIQDSWKEKSLPNSVKVPLNNLILKKCAAKSLQFQEDLNLPSHIPLPQIQIQPPKKTEDAEEKKEN